VLAAVLAIVLTRGGTAAASGEVAPNDVGLIDAKSGKISARISVGHAPAGVAAARDAIWVTNADENSVSRIDPKTNDVRQTIPVGGSPSGIAVGGNAVWVANGLDGSAGILYSVRTFDQDSSLATEAGYDQVTGVGAPASGFAAAIAAP